MTSARHQRILAWLQDCGTLSVADIARQFDVTPMTVWRDLKLLAELGLVRRVRGGVQAAGAAALEPGFEAKDTRDWSAKARIAGCAAREFVKEGTVVVLEGGTTVAALVGRLPKARISILTNSTPVALRVRALRPALPVRVVGGWLSPVSGNLTGPEALREIGKLTADVCFLGATAFDETVGPSDPNPLEIEVKRAWAAIAERTVMLLDSRKFGRRSGSVTIHPRRLHALVTDASPPRAIKSALESNGVRLCIAG